MKTSNKMLIVMLLLTVLLTSANSNAQKKPNIVVILADDLGYNDLGVQGSKIIKSPNIDRLANSGVAFSNAYVTASVCSPSRAGLISGQYQQRFGHEANVPPKNTGMDPKVKTIAGRLKNYGYKTGIVGKWHLGSSDSRYPTNKGFDYFYGFREGHRNYYYDPKGNDRPGDHHAMEENGVQVSFDGYITDRLTDKAIGFIDKEKENPFFLLVSYNAPHGPFQSKIKDEEHYPNLEGRRQKYANMIWSMDEGVGRLYKKLEKEGLLENTLIWFLSDNGGIDGFTEHKNNYPLSGNKGLKFEGGVRVPYFMSWQGVLPKNKTYNKAVSSLDIAATSLALAGACKSETKELDGVNLIPFITGAKTKAPHKTLYWKRLNFAAVRSGNLKMIRVKNYGSALYNLNKDIGEHKNLSVKQPKEILKFTKMLESWESKLIKPLWEEGTEWSDIIKQQHINIIENKPFESAKTLFKKNKKI